MQTCDECFKNYKDEEKLKRHKRACHAEKFEQCRFCPYEVPVNVKYRLKKHEARRHQEELEKEKKTSTPVPDTRTFVPFSALVNPIPIYLDITVPEVTPAERNLFPEGVKKSRRTGTHPQPADETGHIYSY